MDVFVSDMSEVLCSHSVFKYECFDQQEWEGFTGTLVSDMKAEGGRGIPSWIDQERQTAVANLKVNHRVALFLTQNDY